MEFRIASLAVLCLALAAIPVIAQFHNYDNGPINGTTDAWTINYGYIVSDSFTNHNFMAGFDIGLWEFPGDTVYSIDWSVTTAENGGTTLGSGTASGSNVRDEFISTNQYGYDIDKVSVAAFVSGLADRGTYWLNLQNARVSSGDPVYWDENSGVGCGSPGCPSTASEGALALGTIPSEAFTIDGGDTGAVPEPSSIMLFASGILGLAGVVRRKRQFPIALK